MLHREVQEDALTGETNQAASELRNQESGYAKQKAVRSMALSASHALILHGRRPRARREVLRAETGCMR